MKSIWRPVHLLIIMNLFIGLSSHLFLFVCLFVCLFLTFFLCFIKSLSLISLFFFMFFLVFFFPLLSLWGNSGRHTWVSATESYKCMLGLYVFRNPPNFDTDYRIFNVRTWSFLCVRLHRVGHTDNDSAQHSLLGKTFTIISCAPDGVLIWGLWISCPKLYQLSHPSPITNQALTYKPDLFIFFFCGLFLSLFLKMFGWSVFFC